MRLTSELLALAIVAVVQFIVIWALCRRLAETRARLDAQSRANAPRGVSGALATSTEKDSPAPSPQNGAQ